jgi:hypothetical protein
MIAGELESAFDDGYDYFFGSKKRKAKKEQKKAQKKAQKQSGTAKPKANIGQLIKKAGEKIDAAGGLGAIGSTAENVRSFLRKPDPSTPAPEADYKIEIPKTIVQDEAKAKKEREKKLIITAAVIVGSLLVIGGVMWYVTSQKKMPSSVGQQSINK